jgi:hypothetical protein
MKMVLENGAEIIRTNAGYYAEVGMMQTDEQPEAWLYWLDAQSITSQRDWKLCTKERAVENVNELLGSIGLTLQNDQIVELVSCQE